jgi:hypothetical protein
MKNTLYHVLAVEEVRVVKVRPSEGSAMRDEFKTSFWRRAFKSLPPIAQRRYRSQLKSAERWELALDRAIDIASRGKSLLARLWHTAQNRYAG